MAAAASLHEPLQPISARRQARQPQHRHQHRHQNRKPAPDARDAAFRRHRCAPRKLFNFCRKFGHEKRHGHVGVRESYDFVVAADGLGLVFEASCGKFARKLEEKGARSASKGASVIPIEVPGVTAAENQVQTTISDDRNGSSSNQPFE